MGPFQSLTSIIYERVMRGLLRYFIIYHIDTYTLLYSDNRSVSENY